MIKKCVAVAVSSENILIKFLRLTMHNFKNSQPVSFNLLGSKNLRVTSFKLYIV